MDLFNSIARGGDSFYFRKGSVITTTPWWRPSFTASHSMLTKVKESTDIFSRYSVNIVGGCLFSWDRTWDLDIQLHSDSFNPDQLEIDFLRIYEIALNGFYILPDVSWNSIEHPHSVEECIFKSPLDDFGKRVSIIETEKIINSDRAFIKLTDESGYEQISRDLCISNGKFPGEKLYNRIHKNPDCNFVLSYPVEDFLNGSEMDFIKNSNHLKIR
jgi:hypothetical protein